MLFDASRGEFIIDSKENHLKRSGVILPVTHDGKPWCYLQLSAADEVHAHALRQIRAELQHEKSGLYLECPANRASLDMLLPKELSQLVKEFGSVLLRGFAPLADAEQLQTWYLNHRSAVT